MRHSVPDPTDSNNAFSELDQALSRAAATNADDDFVAPVVDPDRPRALLLSTVFGAAVLMLAAVVGYTSSLFAVDRAAAHTDTRVAVLESDLQQRRSAAATQNASRDAQIAELRRLVCLFADHSQPRDDVVQEVRIRYGCVLPSPSPSPATSGR